MTDKRNAELQRKLSMIEVPRPPEGLAEQIKREIPAHLNASQRPFRQASFMKIAAMLLVVIGTLLVTRQFFPRLGDPVESPEASTAATRERLEPEGQTTQLATGETGDMPQADAGSAADSVLPAAEPPRPSLATQERSAESLRTAPAAARPGSYSDDLVNGSTGAVTGQATANKVQASGEPERERLPVTTAPAAPPPPPAAPPPPAPAPVANEARAEMSSIAADAPSSAAAHQTPVQPRAGRTTAAGEPPTERRGLDQLAREFGVSPASSRDTASLESKVIAPIPGSRGGTLVHLGAYLPSVAAGDGRLEIAIDAQSVASYRLLGDASAATHATMGAQVIPGTGAGRLLELEIAAGVDPARRIVTARLRYTADGSEQTIERTLRAGELATASSHSLRRTTLASIWIEALRRDDDAMLEQLVVLSRRLLSERPSDPLTRDLHERIAASAPAARKRRP